MTVAWEDPIPHSTNVKVVSGAVRITVDGKTLSALTTVTEPSEDVSGGSQINVINLNHPLENVSGAYLGGSFTMTLHETWYKTPYEEMGFDGVEKYIDVINHKEFDVNFVTFRPDGSLSYMTAYGSRLSRHPKPGGNIDRLTNGRTITVNLTYTHLEYS